MVIFDDGNKPTNSNGVKRRKISNKKRSPSKPRSNKDNPISESNINSIIKEINKMDKKVSFSDDEKRFLYEEEEKDLSCESIGTFSSDSSCRSLSRESRRRKWKQLENTDSYHTIIAGRECTIKKHNKKI